MFTITEVLIHTPMRINFQRIDRKQLIANSILTLDCNENQLPENCLHLKKNTYSDCPQIYQQWDCCITCGIPI